MDIRNQGDLSSLSPPSSPAVEARKGAGATSRAHTTPVPASEPDMEDDHDLKLDVPSESDPYEQHPDSEEETTIDVRAKKE